MPWCPALARTPGAGFYGAGVPMIRNSAIPIALALLAAVFLTASGASPARADRCDDLAAQLKNQIDGLAVGKTAANVIYLSHPQAKELSLGCSGRSYSNQFFAKAGARRPPDGFVDLAASGAAIVFTLPKDDTMTGTARCLKRMGILRGDKVTMRYRRLDLECTRTKTEASIVVRRGLDQ